MKKLLTLICALLLSLSLAACDSNGSDDTKTVPNTSTPTVTETVTTTENVEIPNPFADCDTLAEAASLAGFDVTVPDSVEGYPNRLIQVEENKVIQVFYQSDDSSDEVLIRKALGTEDPSGDYNDYASVETVEVNGLEVTVKGDGSLCNLAVWSDGDYAYSIQVTAGMEQEALAELTALVK